MERICSSAFSLTRTGVSTSGAVEVESVVGVVWVVVLTAGSWRDLREG
jgi:hypothetical protein